MPELTEGTVIGYWDEYAVVNKLLSNTVELVFFPRFQKENVPIKRLAVLPYRVLSSQLSTEEMEKIRLILTLNDVFKDVEGRIEQEEMNALTNEYKHLSPEDDGVVRVFENIEADLNLHFPGVVFFLSGDAKKHNTPNAELCVTWEDDERVTREAVEGVLRKFLLGRFEKNSHEFEHVVIPFTFLFGGVMEIKIAVPRKRR